MAGAPLNDLQLSLVAGAESRRRGAYIGNAEFARPRGHGSQGVGNQASSSFTDAREGLPAYPLTIWFMLGRRLHDPPSASEPLPP